MYSMYMYQMSQKIVVCTGSFYNLTGMKFIMARFEARKRNYIINKLQGFRMDTITTEF